MKTDLVVVGTGLAGATVAERAAAKGLKVLVVEKRDHIAGNTYDEMTDHGVLIHRYGPHIFHTNSERVWKYLSQFTTWRLYSHQVLGMVEGREVPIPFNIDSIEALFSRTTAQRIIDKLLKLYGFSTHIPILELKTQDDPDLSFLADFVYRSVFLNYTLKQWGTSPEALLPSVTARVPIRVSRDPRYFRDTYQGMPKDGYTALVRRMLASPRIKLLLNCAWEDIATEIGFERLVYTGAIDGWFHYEHGKLAYRSLRFAPEKIDAPYFQKVGTVNYPNNFDFTRITDYNRLSGVRAAVDTIVREYPDTYEEAKNDPYYPFPTDAATALYTKYKNMAKALLPKIIFLGRMGEFKYYNMDEVTLATLEAFDKYFG